MGNYLEAPRKMGQLTIFCLACKKVCGGYFFVISVLMTRNNHFSYLRMNDLLKPKLVRKHLHKETDSSLHEQYLGRSEYWIKCNKAENMQKVVMDS